MPDISRRRFIRDASFGAAAASAVAMAGPGLISATETTAADTTAVDATGAAAADVTGAAAFDGPLVAHVVNAQTGEMAIYVGTREISYTDPAIARQIAAAASH